MLHIYFKQTMDHYGIKGSELAEAMGCSRNNISEIRTGKTKPQIDRFWELIETIEQLAPGAKCYFSNLISENNTTFLLKDKVNSIDTNELVAAMNDEQLSKLMFAVAARLGNKKNNKQIDKREELAAIA